MTAQDQLIRSRLDSVDARPLIEELNFEYSTRYADYNGFNKPKGAPEEIDLFPPLLFEPPYGDFLLIRRGFESIAGGAFMYLDDETAEIKRVWTSRNHRRQGLSRKIMAELERAAAERGYRRIYLTTGPRQPEAKNLYLAIGYTPLFDVNADPEEVVSLAFEKEITPLRDGVELSGIRTKIRGYRQRRAVEKTYRWRPRPAQRLSTLGSTT